MAAVMILIDADQGHHSAASNIHQTPPSSGRSLASLAVGTYFGERKERLEMDTATFLSQILSPQIPRAQKRPANRGVEKRKMKESELRS